MTTSPVAALTRRTKFGLVCAVLIGATACKSTFSDIIAVDPADRVSEPVLFNDPNQATLLTSSAQGQFECAYADYVLTLGLLVGELNSLGATQFYSVDARRPDPAGGFSGQYAVNDCNSGIGLYVPLSSARFFADKVLTTLQGWTDAQVPNRSALIAQAAAYSGYSYLLLGEGFCSMAIDAGPELTPAQVFALANDKFAVAIAAAQSAGASAADFLNMALVGRARSRLNLADNAGALADAQAVPASFARAATRALGNPLRENQIYDFVNRSVALGLGPDYFDVRWNDKPDPRVPAVFAGQTTTNVARYTQTKYASESAPIPLATGVEAQLIIAEIQGGQAAVDIINALHAAVGLDPFTSSDPTEISNQVIEERRRAFFLEGHRNYDRIRFSLPLDPPPGSPYRWGGLFADAKCLPLPDVERLNNPNMH
jgi:hypothetical protein